MFDWYLLTFAHIALTLAALYFVNNQDLPASFLGIYLHSTIPGLVFYAAQHRYPTVANAFLPITRPLSLLFLFLFLFILIEEYVDHFGWLMVPACVVVVAIVAGLKVYPTYNAALFWIQVVVYAFGAMAAGVALVAMAVLRWWCTGGLNEMGRMAVTLAYCAVVLCALTYHGSTLADWLSWDTKVQALECLCLLWFSWVFRDRVTVAFRRAVS